MITTSKLNQFRNQTQVYPIVHELHLDKSLPMMCTDDYMAIWDKVYS